jgi:hypothetical protein
LEPFIRRADRARQGKPLRTLRDAANHVIALPARESKQEHWQTAMAVPYHRDREARDGHDGEDCRGASAASRKVAACRCVTE